MAEALRVPQNEEAVRFLEAEGLAGPRVGFVLGSGWGRFVDSTEVVAACDYGRIPGFGRSTVPGHAGRLVRGRAGAVEYLAMQGRMHLYEGHPFSRIGSAMAVLSGLGVRELVVTSAVGSVHPDLEVGDLVAVRDTIDFMGENPLGALAGFGPGRQISRRIHGVMLRTAREGNHALKEGVLLASKGPTYETPAEVRMARSLGADVVGMSTVPELIAASALGVEACALTCVTNRAAGVVPGGTVTHEEVIEAMNRRVPQLAEFLRSLLGTLERCRSGSEAR